MSPNEANVAKERENLMRQKSWMDWTTQQEVAHTEHTSGKVLRKQWEEKNSQKK
jgi:hypothetical protein